MRSQFSLTCCLVALSLLAGCNSAPADRPKLGQVTGTVKLDGKPLALVSVVFMPVDGQRGSTGETDETGVYTLQYTDTVPGAVLGEHTVQIVPPEGSEIRIPAKYSGESALKHEVKSGKNEIHLELES